jgi:hypothetical protein
VAWQAARIALHRLGRRAQQLGQTSSQALKCILASTSWHRLRSSGGFSPSLDGFCSVAKTGRLSSRAAWARRSALASTCGPVDGGHQAGLVVDQHELGFLGVDQHGLRA